MGDLSNPSMKSVTVLFVVYAAISQLHVEAALTSAVSEAGSSTITHSRSAVCHTVTHKWSDSKCNDRCGLGTNCHEKCDERCRNCHCNAPSFGGAAPGQIFDQTEIISDTQFANTEDLIVYIGEGKWEIHDRRAQFFSLGLGGRTLTIECPCSVNGQVVEKTLALKRILKQYRNFGGRLNENRQELLASQYTPEWGQRMMNVAASAMKMIECWTQLCAVEESESRMFEMASPKNQSSSYKADPLLALMATEEDADLEGTAGSRAGWTCG